MQVIILLFTAQLLFFGKQPDAEDARYNTLYPILNEYIRNFPKELRKIPEERRYRLNEIVYFLEDQQQNRAPWQVTFISSNESAAGQMALAWSRAAAYYFGFTDFTPNSGGMVPEQIPVSAILSLEKAGFIIYKAPIGGIDVYRVKYTYNLEPLVMFPKKIDHVKNPANSFMAVVLDSNAELNIKNIRGTYNRLFLEYEDPSGYVGSDMEKEKFDELCRQVAVEMFYVFSQLRKRKKVIMSN